ncbi:CPBP family intramembrane metalloprotease [Spiractinospora alimapuensis]|uniref:CPBP family intramembrane glutamic endopeptidase n=1 Tax=Spiractinospora alimapuensis TaxID=2820884 RepID=UPI001F1B4F84|nr:type II CAAX endopeptidase family protein [Spiractinospora alimapuensis]QVQ50775.1 CPBP family intramembrane metalloprotease [Spiractinospora alimapuensis]
MTPREPSASPTGIPPAETPVKALRFAQLGRPALGRSLGRTVLALVSLGGLTLVSAAVVIVVLVMTGVGEVLLADEAWLTGPAGVALGLLAMPVVLLPATWLTARWVLRMRLGEVCSVTGRFRWWLYWRGFAAAGVVVVASTVLSHWLGGQTVGTLSTHWLVVVVILVCGVPLAAFVEELTYRGVLTHILGARWAAPTVAVAVPAVVTSALFSLAHGPAGALPFLAHAVGGVAYAVLCDRTGGLEASAAAHTAWNLVLLGSVSLFEGSAEVVGPVALAVPLLLTDLAIVAAFLLTLRGSGVRRLRPVQPDAGTVLQP